MSLFLPLAALRKRWIFRQCSQSEGGEYYPTNSWSGDLALVGDIDVHVTVGRHRAGFSYGIRLRCASLEQEVATGVCGSVKAAERIAGATDYAEHVGRLLARQKEAA